MKRRILLIIMTLLLAMGLMTTSVFAAGSGNILFADPMYCVEDDDLSALNDKLDEISQRQECEVAIYTTKTFGGSTASEYADDYYDEYSYGYGDDKSGIMLVINTESRDWAISTCGFGIKAFTDAGQQYIMDEIKPELSDEDYAAAFDQYADLCDQFLTQAHKGEPYDKGSLPGQEKGMSLPIDIIIGIIIGVIVAFIVVSRDKSALKTVRREAEAKNYMREGSLNITARQEQFIYKDVEQIAKESSGGSGTHTSSSGETHGGSSGKF